MKLIIDRQKWLRGEEKSYLLRARDQKMCCLGFYARACGLSNVDIANIATPVDTNKNFANWLFSGNTYELTGKMIQSRDCEDLMLLNDQVSEAYNQVAEDAREKDIAAIFSRHDVEVEFIN